MIVSEQLKKKMKYQLDIDEKESIGRRIFAFVPVVLVGVLNKVFTTIIPQWYPNGFDFLPLDEFSKH